MVQHHPVLDGDAVTLIAWQNGKPVFKNGRVATESACCCGKCSGPCALSSDCTEGCRCLNGQCVNECSGPCNSSEDCDQNCECLGGQCTGVCCFSGINCDIVVTVTYSNGQTRTNGQYQIREDGSDIMYAPLIGYTVTDCNRVSFAHWELVYFGPGYVFPCYQVAYKTQAINCTTCCDDGTACDCSMGDVITENYEPYGGFNGDCSGPPSTVYVTNISFSIANCGDCPCEFP